MDLEQFELDIHRHSLNEIFDKYPHIEFKIIREPTDCIKLPAGISWVCDCGCGVVTPGYFTRGYFYTADASESVFNCTIEVGLASPCIDKCGEHYSVTVWTDLPEEL
ncbi:hypothetical protein [Buttiauxella sp.]|uniref:hypothetical protein n=1 Tax=Buttiauxella sp. TaxID=1972222 RepID=UPI003C746187